MSGKEGDLILVERESISSCTVHRTELGAFDGFALEGLSKCLHRLMECSRELGFW